MSATTWSIRLNPLSAGQYFQDERIVTIAIYPDVLIPFQRGNIFKAIRRSIAAMTDVLIPFQRGNIFKKLQIGWVCQTPRS